MGNVLQITCDGAIFNRCLDCFLGKVAYIRNLEDNVVALEKELASLIAKKNDLMARVVDAERQQMRKLDQVQLWLSSVAAVEAEAGELIKHRSQEIEILCLGGYCSKNCKSSYKFGKQVAKQLRDVNNLMAGGAFERVAEKIPESVVDERPTEPTVVGQQSQLEQVWKCLVEGSAGIIGLYGMGGVGKTTLLTHINNKFLQSSTDFDFVIWVVVSKDLQIEKIQESIGEKIGLLNDTWKNRRIEQKALDIFRILKKKKFVLLLDDIWQRVDLVKVGVPLPSPQKSSESKVKVGDPLPSPEKSSESKVVFTTRSEEVCGWMEAHQNFKVACLSHNDAWELFQQKVGEETLNCHPEILELARTVAKECGGLPLALITIGRAMACKKRPEEWKYAIEVLRTSSSQFAGLGNEVYPLLKFSYDNLPNDTIKSCLLYCSLYPEDCLISKENLIDCWIGEGFLNEIVKFGVQKEGYHIVGILVRACLLEEVGDDDVKLHDVIRDMALWIACDIEKEKENYLVYAGAGLTEVQDVREWEKVRRLSLMENQIKVILGMPRCPHLLTLFLNNNVKLRISDGFLQYMSSLKVLSLSHNEVLFELPSDISRLVSLELLDLSNSRIRELPEELAALVNLRCLNLEYTFDLAKIPWNLISNFSRLHVLRMFGNAIRSGSFDGDELMVKELLGLKHLEVLSFTLRSSHALKSFLTSHQLRSCTQALLLHCFKDSSLDVSGLADLKQFNRLRIADCPELVELKIDYKVEAQQFCFQSLRVVVIDHCTGLKDLTFLVFASNLKSIEVRSCFAMEDIISVGKFADFPEVMANLNPFAKLQYLQLAGLPNLKSIYWKPLPFSHLKEMSVFNCDKLKKLPLVSNTAKECKLVICGEPDWWKELEWEDKPTQDAFLPCFKSFEWSFLIPEQ